MFELTEDYCIGIPEIDREHEYIVKLFNDADRASKKEGCDIRVLAEELADDLCEYAQMHFLHEEAYMEKINDPELPRQKKEHEAFFQKVYELKIDEGFNREDLDDLLKFLARWLFRHILGSDMMIGKIEPAAKKDIFEFTPEYATGIDLIDNEHRVLFAIVREANDLITNELLHDKYDSIMAILSRLADYTKQHFRDEEDYMKLIAYPRLSAQKAAHAAFVEKIVNIDLERLDAIDENQHKYLIELIDYLISWLINHILKSDKLIGEWERELA